MMIPNIKTVLEHTAAGRKIDAIKALRWHTHMGLKEAKDWVEAVEPYVKKTPAPQPKPDPMAGRVEVRDSKNTDRVLGSIPRPRGNVPKLDGGDRYRMTTCGPITAFEFDSSAACSPTVYVVDFGFRCVNWTVVLITEAPLDMLVRIDDFRLPGENAEQAHVRRMYAR
jgi:hypothetical protein